MADRKPAGKLKKIRDRYIEYAIVFRLGSAKRQILFTVRETRQEIYELLRS